MIALSTTLASASFVVSGDDTVKMPVDLEESLIKANQETDEVNEGIFLKAPAIQIWCYECNEVLGSNKDCMNVTRSAPKCQACLKIQG